MRKKSYKKESVIIFDDEILSEVYLIEKGSVEVEFFYLERLSRHVVGPGDFLGILFSLSRTKSLICARAIDDCEVLILSLKDFFSFIEDKRNLESFFSRYLNLCLNLEKPLFERSNILHYNKSVSKRKLIDLMFYFQKDLFFHQISEENLNSLIAFYEIEYSSGLPLWCEEYQKSESRRVKAIGEEREKRTHPESYFQRESLHKEGEMIQCYGHEEDTLCFILEGEVGLFDIESKKILSLKFLLSEGSCLNPESYLFNKSFNYVAIALNPVRLQHLSTAEAATFLSQSPQMFSGFIINIARASLYGLYFHHLHHFSSKDIRTYLAIRVFLKLKNISYLLPKVFIPFHDYGLVGFFEYERALDREKLKNSINRQKIIEIHPNGFWVRDFDRLMNITDTYWEHLSSSRVPVRHNPF